jgi:hypothetical protein
VRVTFLLLLVAAVMQAAVDGAVANGTTGKPQPGVAVTLVSIGGAGMQPQGTVTSGAEGKFRFEESPAGAALIQAVYQGVTYHLMLQPGSPSSGLQIEVYESSPRPGDAKVVQDIVLLEPSDSQLLVRENIIWENRGKVTYRDAANGTLRFYVPPEGKGALRVSATAPNGLPLDQRAVPAGQKDVYTIDFPIKPGDTTVEVSYTVPLADAGTFSGRSLQKGAPLRLVVPQGVSLSGEGLEPLGQEPRSRASIYGVPTPDYKVGIQAASAPAASEEEEGGSGFDQILPRIYDNVHAIVGLALLILATGFALLYGMRTTASEAPPAAGSKKRR